MKDKQFLNDLLAFTRFVHYNDEWDVQKKYNALVSTLGHDLNGLIEDEPFFSPRVTGYSRSPRATFDRERLAINKGSVNI